MDFSDEMADEILKIFQVESEEIISKINNSLLDLEKKPNNKDAILNLFRDAHSLKGASRMIGFNSVQTVAHKMEDVLGLAKENKISINSNVVNILYNTVDFLSKLIHKSLKKGKDVYDKDITEQIALLENIETYADEAKSDSEQPDFDIDFLTQNIEKINNLISESLFFLMKIEARNNSELIAELLRVVTELYTILKEIGLYDIKNCVEDVKVKLEFILKASNSLTLEETEEIQKNIDFVINKITSLSGLCNFELVDYYSIAFDMVDEVLDKSIVQNVPSSTVLEKENEQNLQEIIIEQDNVDDLPEEENQLSIDLIQTVISNLINNKISPQEVGDLIEQYLQTCVNTEVKDILQKVAEIVSFASLNEIQINEETLFIINQSLQYCKNITEGSDKTTDNALFFQQLEIVKQVMELEKTKAPSEVFSTFGDIKAKNLTDFSEIFNTSAIKTLRVDSEKLDSLINQVNELTITNIKTKKHLFELSHIGENIENWQKNLTKILNYLRYYDKKYNQSEGEDNSASVLIKQFLGLFSQDSIKIQKIYTEISQLYKTIQEDDAKMDLAIDELNNMVKNIRILPFATIFHMFGRMVRDIAQEKGKMIELEIVGSDTCTDKKIIEEIKNPLIHIIRNSIDHGIETPKEREALGKNPAGKILLSARQSNNKVFIEITDDGRGLNLAKIKEKALQKGFLTREELDSMTDEQVTNIIFAPGFSTGDEITNISGRGIGLDVVQSKISQLNGKVKLVSEVNKGCCIQIELPTTMSLLKVFIVEAAGQNFAVPIEMINSALKKRVEEIIVNNGKKSIIFNGETIALYNLCEILNLEQCSTNKDKLTILIIENDNKTIALNVDELIGEQEILHKRLSAPFYKLKNIAGITTLISGETCLILNIVDIINTAGTAKSLSNLIPTQKVSHEEFNILLVDDSATTRTLERNILTKLGYKVELAENPIQAFEKLRTMHFDLIISDIEMPEMNGLVFLEKLKSDEMYSEIPVIMVSSLVNEEYKKRAAALGAEKYIVKNDFNQDDFEKTVGYILSID